VAHAPAPTRPLAVSLGDPAGVGPELLATAWAAREVHGLAPFFAVFGGELIAQASARRGLHVPIRRIDHPSEAAAVFAEALPVLGDADLPYAPGQPDRAGAALALASLEQAAALAVDGDAAALVTGPVAKGRLAEVGFAHPGQTEFVAAACEADPADAVMMLAGPSLRTVPLTVHVALSQVPALITRELIERRGAIVARALSRDFGIAAPRLAVTALNPHGGEGGLFGDEDQRIVAPAVAALQAAGIDAEGPHAADALFAPHNRHTFDAALCMYHDQALIPIKALDFESGVNITLGLKIVRTSPDHGTAFAIAGKAAADPGATIAAIRMAAECAGRREMSRSAAV